MTPPTPEQTAKWMQWSGIMSCSKELMWCDEGRVAKLAYLARADLLAEVIRRLEDCCGAGTAPVTTIKQHFGVK